MNSENAFSMLTERWRSYLAGRGIVAPTHAQAAAMPSIHAGQHTLLIAPTGMGKTESAILPLFDLLLRERERPSSSHSPSRRRGISLIYVTPLRALNRDLMARLHEWGKAMGIDVRVRHGDTTPAERARQAREPPDVLITTPETMQLLFLGSKLVKMLENVRWVVLDEVHELASDERGAQLAVALERLVKDRKSTRLNSSHQIISYAVFCLKKKRSDALVTAMSSTVDSTAPFM